MGLWHTDRRRSPYQQHLAGSSLLTSVAQRQSVDSTDYSSTLRNPRSKPKFSGTSKFPNRFMKMRRILEPKNLIFESSILCHTMCLYWLVLDLKVTKILNISLLEHKIPSICRTVRIILINKSGEPEEKSEFYMPISLLSPVAGSASPYRRS